MDSSFENMMENFELDELDMDYILSNCDDLISMLNLDSDDQMVVRVVTATVFFTFLAGYSKGVHDAS